MNIISEKYKTDLLEIAENFPGDIEALINYLEEKLQNKISSYKPSQLEDFKFFIMKSFDEKISNFKDGNKCTQELVETLQEVWKNLFEEKLQGQRLFTLDIGDTRYYTELDFTELNQNLRETSPSNHVPPLGDTMDFN